MVRTGDNLKTLVELEESFIGVAEKALPSVVTIHVYERAQGDRRDDASDGQQGKWRAQSPDSRVDGFRRIRMASGVLLTADGYIASYRDLVVDPESEEIADAVYVELVDRGYKRVRVAGLEPRVNLALLKVELYEPVQPATLGDSESLKIGQWIIALGDPEGPGKSFSVGSLASTPNQDCYQEKLNVTQLRSSVKVPAESLGGPVVNIRGEVIGVSVPSPTVPGEADGSEYAVPIKLVMTVLDALKENESTRSPFLGVAVQTLSRFVRKKLKKPPLTGVYVENVYDPSPAAEADIRIGDVIVAMDGKRIFAVKGFQKWLYTLGIGKTFEIQVSRDGETLVKTTTIVERPREAARE